MDREVNLLRRMVEFALASLVRLHHHRGFRHLRQMAIVSASSTNFVAMVEFITNQPLCAIQVNHNGQIQPAFMGSDVDVPDLIR